MPRSGPHPADLDLTLPPGDEVEVRALDGARLAATVAGRGPTVVLAHCWTGSRAVWAPVARRLVYAGHRVVLYDQRGHGESEVGSELFTVEQLGHDLAAVIEQLDVHDAVLAGHSMGGMTVMSAAAVRPELVAERARGLVLVATAAGGLARWGLEHVLASVNDDLVSSVMTPPWLGAVLVRGTFGRAAARPFVEATRDLFTGTAAEVRRGALLTMAEMDLRETLADISTPTIVMVGSRDTLTPRSFARALAERIPGARLDVLPAAGHMLPFERPLAVARAIRELSVG